MRKANGEDSPHSEAVRLDPQKAPGQGKSRPCGKMGMFHRRGRDKRAEPWPTFQRCGDAAHLVEARVALTADDLREEAGRRLGKGQRGREALGGREGSGGSSAGKREARPVLSGNRNHWSHKVPELRGTAQANAERTARKKASSCLAQLPHTAPTCAWRHRRSQGWDLGFFIPRFGSIFLTVFCVVWQSLFLSSLSSSLHPTYTNPKVPQAEAETMGFCGLLPGLLASCSFQGCVMEAGLWSLGAHPGSPLTTVPWGSRVPVHLSGLTETTALPGLVGPKCRCGMG